MEGYWSNFEEHQNYFEDPWKVLNLTTITLKVVSIIESNLKVNKIMLMVTQGTLKVIRVIFKIISFFEGH